MRELRNYVDRKIKEARYFPPNASNRAFSSFSIDNSNFDRRT